MDTAIGTTSGPVIRSAQLRVVGGAAAPTEGLLETLLREQQSLTAVERFSRLHEEGEFDGAVAKRYKALIPTARPNAGQQYAFEVNLDACTGCKACVAACHSLNGLDEAEVWRTVGLLHGGSLEAPAQQTVTTACHHCVDPACMNGCPVKAYEKDPVTGVVRHLDDQCIGCQYCTLMCPYDAPKYNKAKGIVRKCDMCTDRLAVGEAPACVQGCPNEAIRIRIVDHVEALAASEAGTFLPGAPAPDHTVPTTVYKTERPAARALLPADFYAVSSEHSHPPLVIMLVLTQLAVGAFGFDVVTSKVFGGGHGSVESLFATAVALLALGASTLHLGRPQYAFRAFLGLRTSWLSREAIGFGVFAKFAVLSAVSALGPRLPEFPGRDVLISLHTPVTWAATAIGFFGVFSSVMVYVATQRAHWRASVTGFKFFGTLLLLGAAAVFMVSTVFGAPTPRETKFLLLVITGATTGKLLVELSLLRHVRARTHTVFKRMALLMLRDLRFATLSRFVLGVGAGIVVPVLLLTRMSAMPNTALRAAAIGILVVATVAELLERYLFFTAAPPSRMPGALS